MAATCVHKITLERILQVKHLTWKNDCGKKKGMLGRQGPRLKTDWREVERINKSNK